MTENNPSSGVQAYKARGEALARDLADVRARMRRMKFDTIAVSGVYDLAAALGNQGSIIEPAYLSSAQAYENSDHLEAALAGQMPAWVYSRYGNPTVGYLEETLALLEGYGFPGEVRACATASGMAAINLATETLLTAEATGGAPRPVNFVASARCYGGTFMLFNQRYAGERGYAVRWVKDPLDLEAWARRIDPNTRFLYAEMPSNPSLAVCDLTTLADLAHSHDIPLIVDSTVATPALLRPLGFGADIVVHSVSKSMSVSGFAIAGALIARQDIPSRVGPPALRADFASFVKREAFREHGAGISPFSALLILNDLRTLRMRMDFLSQNAMKVASTLAAHPNVERVAYPGLPGWPGHAVAARFMALVDSEMLPGGPHKRYGHLLSFEVRGGAAATRRVYDNLLLIWRAADLGRIKSLATIPAISTHQKQGESARELADISPNMIRLSVGAEYPDDIIADLEQALAVD